MTLKEKLEGILEIKLDSIKPDDKLIALGLDSIKIVETCGLIEEELNIRIDYDEIYNLDGKWLHNILTKKIEN
jgi:acyl carrier protein